MGRKTKKIVILYASAGHGHEKAARALEAVCRVGAAWEVLTVDVLKLTAWGFGDRYRALYFFLIKRFPWLWGLFYALSDISSVYFLIRPLRRINNALFAKKLEAYLCAEMPDVIISTHFLGSEVAAHLKRKAKIRSRLVTVVTDYMPHAFWIASGTDSYAVATSLTKESMRRRGVPDGSVHVTGIPIDPKFSAKLEKDEARKMLGLKADLFTVLITSGGAGVGITDDVIARLSIIEPKIQQLVVCGTNKELFARLKDKYGQRASIHLYGFVENIHELMAACDLVVGKGGGLTITECLSVGRPMVLFGAVPGQETRNVQQITDFGAARAARSLHQVVRHVLEFQKNKAVMENALAAIDKIRCLDSAHQVIKIAVAG